MQRILTRFVVLSWLLIGLAVSPLIAQQASLPSPIQPSYDYEAKSDDPAFEKFFPAKAPPPGELLLKTGDRLAIIGDSITEQKMYSRIIENYLTACVPDLQVTVRQYGWSGEKTDGFLRRMERDCLTFDPTIATICYGMNDARYRPFDITNGNWYRDHYTAIVRKFKERGVRVIVGSPGCSGKIASWVNPKAGTLDEHNLNLCALRDIALHVSLDEHVAFADIFWPMYQQRILAPRRFNKTEEEYAVAGKDGIHPGWAGQAIMAYAFLHSMGLDGDLGTINVDLANNTATVTGKHEVQSFSFGTLKVLSRQYPYCARGPIDDDNSLRSGMSLVPFHDELNRLTLKIVGNGDRPVKVTWGSEAKTFAAEEVSLGINLAAHFENNPFCESFEKLDAAVYAKQAYETRQVKEIFHGKQGKANFEQAVTETEAERRPLAEAVASAVVPVEHVMKIEIQ